eukprot:jgi/Botrbrau1/10880/Bobra.0025s0057.1
MKSPQVTITFMLSIVLCQFAASPVLAMDKQEPLENRHFAENAAAAPSHAAAGPQASAEWFYPDIFGTLPLGTAKAASKAAPLAAPSSHAGPTNDGGVGQLMENMGEATAAELCGGQYGPVLDPSNARCWYFCLGADIAPGNLGIRFCCLLPGFCYNMPTPLFPLGYCWFCSNTPPSPPPPVIVPSPPPPPPSPPPPPVVPRSCPVPAPVITTTCGTNISSIILVFNATADNPNVFCKATYFNIDGYDNTTTYDCTSQIFGKTCDALGGYLYIYMGDRYPLGPSTIVQTYLDTLGIGGVKQVFGLYISKDGAYTGDLQPTFLTSLERIVYGGLSVGTDSSLTNTNIPTGSGLTLLPGLSKLTYVGGVVFVSWTSFEDLSTFSALTCLEAVNVSTLSQLSLSDNAKLTTLSPLNLGATPQGVAYSWSLPEFAALTDITALRRVAQCLINLQSGTGPDNKVVLRLRNCLIESWTSYCFATTLGFASVCPGAVSASSVIAASPTPL